MAADANLELLRRAFDAIARRDVDAVVPLLDPEIEFVSTFAASEGRSYRGHEGVREYFADLEAAWESWEISDPELIPKRDGGVLLLFQARGKGRGSGLVLEQRFGQIWSFRDGKILRGVSYLDADEALRAAGLQA